jgi:predicted Fe-Mo cluster-binding NifX family protein
MLACIPTQGDAGRDDQVHEHFGSAPFFTLYNTENDEIAVIANRNAHHAHGTCHPMNQLAHHHIDCVVCAGMGRRAIEALNSEGVSIYRSEAGTVADIIEKIKANQLPVMDPAKACMGHGQHPVLGAESGPGLGRGAGFGQMRGGQGGGRSREE